MATASGAVLAEKTPTTGQIVVHLDMDCFFAACERLRNPELEGEPVVIGGGFDHDPPRGAVATASYEARVFGVESAQSMSTALELLPRDELVQDDADAVTGYYLKPDHEYYTKISSRVMEIADRYADTMRRVSIDESYLDVTSQTSWDQVEDYVQDLRDEIEQDVGITASAGVAPTLSCAKVASDEEKPDGLCVVEPTNVESFLASLDIEEIHGVGPVTAEKFRSDGIQTAGDLAALTPQEVVDRYGSNAVSLHDRVRGIDDRTVEPVGKRKSISNEKSFEPTDNPTKIRIVLTNQIQRVTERVSAKDIRFQTIGIKIVTTPFDVRTRETTLKGPVQDADILKSTVIDLFQEFEDEEIRKVGVRVSKLDFSDGDQSTLSTWGQRFGTRDTPKNRPLRGQTRLTDF